LKTFIRFSLTCLISTGALLSATKAANPWPCFGVMALVWILFAWWLSTKR
jgi:hypothetical protein